MSPRVKRTPRKQKGRKHSIQIDNYMLSTPYVKESKDVKPDSVSLKNHFKPVKSTSFIVSDDPTKLSVSVFIR